MLCMMMGNWIRNSFKATAQDEIELNRKTYAYFCIDQSRFINDRPTMAKVILDIMNPEARVNVRELKKEISNVKITDFEGDVIKMLTHLKLLYDNIISENECYDDFILDILEALHTVQDKSFLVTVERIQDEYNSGATLSTHEVIKRAITKYNNLLKRKTYYYKDPTKKFLNLATHGKVTDDKDTDSNNDNKNSFLKALPEWRKHRILGKDIIEKDGRTFYFCPHHKNASMGYPDGLYVCSHRPDQHEEFVKARKAGKPFKIDDTTAPTPSQDAQTPAGKKLMMAEDVSKVLTTTQPHLDASQIDKLMDKMSSKE